MWEILVAALVSATIGGVLVYSVCHWKDITDWFNSYIVQNKIDYGDVAVLIQEEMVNGKYSVIQGVFNTKKNKFSAARRIEAKDLDDRIKQEMYKKKFIEYQLYG